MKTAYFLLPLLLLCSCGSESVIGEYKLYEDYSTQTRFYKNMIACSPGDRTKVFMPNVHAIKHDDQAIHLLCKQEQKDDSYVLIEPNANGFDCVDDQRTKPMNRKHYESYCETNGYPILLTGEE